MFSGEVDFSEAVQLWVPTYTENIGVSKGENPLGSGFPIGARSTLLAHDFARKV